MLGDRMHDELGYFPRAVWHWLWWTIPGLREAVTELGGLRAAPTPEEMAELKARGEHLIVAPGGMREAMRPFWADGRVDLGDRRGYLRLALRHDLPIIPVVATGLDATFVGFNDGYRTSRRLFRRGDLPAWLAVGMGGIWPLALPFPAKIRQRIGDPILLGTLPAGDEDDRLELAHEHVTTTLQAMLDDLHADHA
jgi:1-acyl-sn-glycerol-3-phosphate acyltransferase